jgi:hypothetical protein
MKDGGFDTALLESGELLKKGFSSLIGNVGRTVAIITLAVAALVTFTDVGFHDLKTASFTSTLLLMLVASYIMFFSLEDAGERLGEQSEEYKAALDGYNAALGEIEPDEIGALRDFCTVYSEEELKFRQRSYLISCGYSPSELDEKENGGTDECRRKRAIMKAKKMKAVILTPSMLLSKERASRTSELKNPERTKLPALVLRLVPITFGMLFTTSVMLVSKDGLTASTVIESIMRLATLPIVGFKGYSVGYTYAKRTESRWISTKTRLLRAYIARRAEGNMA